MINSPLFHFIKRHWKGWQFYSHRDAAREPEEKRAHRRNEEHDGGVAQKAAEAASVKSVFEYGCCQTNDWDMLELRRTVVPHLREGCARWRWWLAMWKGMQSEGRRKSGPAGVGHTVEKTSYVPQVGKGISRNGATWIVSVSIFLNYIRLYSIIPTTPIRKTTNIQVEREFSQLSCDYHGPNRICTWGRHLNDVRTGTGREFSHKQIK